MIQAGAPFSGATPRRPPDVQGGKNPLLSDYANNKWARVLTIMLARRNQDAPSIRRMVTARDYANCDVTVPLLDVTGEPEMDMLIPSLVYDGIEGNAMQASGPSPNIAVPAVTSSDLSRKRADTRRGAYYARWHKSRLPITLRRAYRQLTGYGSCAFLVVPDFKNGGSLIEYRDAMTAYPDPRAAEEIRPLMDCGFVVGRSRQWIMDRYPETKAIFTNTSLQSQIKSINAGAWDGLWDMVEWIDGDDILIGMLGPRDLYAASQTVDPAIHAGSAYLLRQWTNSAGRCTAVVPRRVTLDRIAGQLDNVIPIVDWMARLTALDFIAAERGVFPDMVAIGEDQQEPRIVTNGGNWSDGRSGQINLVAGVKSISNMQSSPGPLTTNAIDRLERAIRTSGRINPMFGGEQPGATVRTGRMADTLGGFSIDPNIKELQEIMSYCLTDVNEIICDMEKGYWPDRKFSLYSGWSGNPKLVEWTPSQDFEIPDNVVTYTFPGVDLSQITVAISQLTAADLMSKKTGRTKHPYIDDPDDEEQLIVEEGIIAAMLTSFEQQAAQGTIPLPTLASVLQKIRTGTHIVDAVLQTQQEEQKRQADQSQAAQAGNMQDPSLQPGMGGAGSQTPDVAAMLAAQQQQGANPEQANLAQLVRATSQPGAMTQRTTGLTGGAPLP